MEVITEEITIVKVSGETSMEIASEEAVSKAVDLIIDMIYYYCSHNKRTIIYIGNLNASLNRVFSIKLLRF